VLLFRSSAARLLPAAREPPEGNGEDEKDRGAKIDASFNPSRIASNLAEGSEVSPISLHLTNLPILLSSARFASTHAKSMSLFEGSPNNTIALHIFELVV